MVKLTVEQVLSSIAALSQSEKSELQSKLLSVLSTSESYLAQGGQSQSQSFGDVNISGNNNAFAATQAGENTDLSQDNSQPSLKNNVDLQEALDLLLRLRQAISLDPSLNAIEKATLEIPIKVSEEELKKSKPDKDLIDQAIASLRKGLEGIQTLAEPVTKVAVLIAKAWLMI
jgi:hypothetical protein